MKYKYIAAVALISLAAVGCNKTKKQNQDQTQPNTQQEQNSTNQDQKPSEDPKTATQTKDNAQGPDYTPHFSSEADVQGKVEGENAPEVVGVDITSSGFSPATITVRKGDYVQFTNKDTVTHWPASDPHPTHTGLPGFDADKALATGENYRFQFNKVGTFGYHDHLHPNLKGTVIVK